MLKIGMYACALALFVTTSAAAANPMERLLQSDIKKGAAPAVAKIEDQYSEERERWIHLLRSTSAEWVLNDLTRDCMHFIISSIGKPVEPLRRTINPKFLDDCLLNTSLSSQQDDWRRKQLAEARAREIHSQSIGDKLDMINLAFKVEEQRRLAVRLQQLIYMKKQINTKVTELKAALFPEGDEEELFRK